MDVALYSILSMRVAMAILLGFMLGFEREITGKIAGLRTHILVCAGSTVFTLLSIYGFKYLTAEGTVGVNDPARIAAQIITGIGFIGAGTVMRQGGSVSGITTAATLWMSAAVGMACGCGMFFLGTIATISTLIILVLVRRFECKFLLNRVFNVKHVEISFSCPTNYINEVHKIIEKNFSTIERIKKKSRNDNKVSVKLNVATNETVAHINQIFSAIENLDSLEVFEVHE